jgi:hypothetical protein
MQTRDVVEREIRTAFAGVMLGDGTSLRQAAVIDNYGEGVSDEQFRQLPQTEVTDDWAKVPWEELESDNVAHLDAKGWRYYIPAFMLSVLKEYNAGSMRVIGTLSSLYPREHLATYHLPRYDLLTYEQKRAIANYLQALPSIVALDTEDLTVVQRALDRYWRQFLPLSIVSNTSNDN